MASEKICYLQSVDNPENKIQLPHNKSVLLGRNQDTGITDLFVSRNHLEILVDLNTNKAVLKPLGKCYSGCNGFALLKNESYNLKQGDRIEVRLGYHKYDLIFEGDQNNEPPTKKAKFDIFNMGSRMSALPKSQLSNNGTSGLWENIDDGNLLIYTTSDCNPMTTVAAFDMDGTLIRPKSGARFPKDFDDWVLNFNETSTTIIAQTLKDLHDSGHKIVVFTNQLGVGRDASNVRNFKKKVENVAQKIGAPIQVFVATTRSIYRKPAPGMWQCLEEKNGPIDLDKSFYVGDAAGRERHWAPKKNKDHSMADRLFALNVKLKFHTPEEYFLKERPAKYSMPEFNPRSACDNDPGDYSRIKFPKKTKSEVIVMVGGPGSGKSFYCRTHVLPKGYVHISRDKLGSWQKCVKLLEETLTEKKSAVIDNTNPDKEARGRYLEVAKKFGVDCRCFWMDVTHGHALHNNRFREMTDKSHQPISMLILNGYKKKFQEPEDEEGFCEIVRVPFVPKFGKEEHKKLYKMYLMES